MVRIHSEQLQQIEGDKMRLKAEMNEELTNYKVQLQQYVHTLEQKDGECNELLDRLQASEKQYDDLSLKYRSLNTSYEKNKISSQAMKVFLNLFVINKKYVFRKTPKQ
jgi:chromosome segregation ATPase